jgi:Rrf2 family transcriptional regulator, iron-sulfur cluster assembly transcription factor
MSIFFSRQCEYAIQSAVYIAKKPAGEWTTVKELTGHLNVPYHFSGKILQNLSRKGVLISMKGTRGGFALAKAAKEVTLFDIVDAVDGSAFHKACVMGFPRCGDGHECSLHDQWGILREKIYQMLVKKTLNDLARDMNKPGYQILP